jgi:cation:H+ antiporter
MSRFLVLAAVGLAAQGGHAVAAGNPAHFLWTAPAIILAAYLIAWGAEAAQFMVSQGLALAILAWLQTMPEFAVEADIAWNAARKTPGYDDHLVTANFTGSIRLLMGFGMPVVYLIWAIKHKILEKKWNLPPINLDPFHSVEIVALFPPTIYFFFIYWRGRLDLLDSVIMMGFYVMYMALLLKMPPEEEGESIEELPWVSRKILKRGRVGRIIGLLLVFLLGGGVLYLCVHPFVESLQAVAVLWLNISAYFFIQWVAPFMSEFPEKVSAFTWAAKQGKAKLGLMNFCSSNVNQMTVLVAMIPMVYAISSKNWGAAIVFSEDQKSEIMLTGLTAGLCMVLLFNMKFEWWDALGMFLLFIIQFLSPWWAGWVGKSNHDVRVNLAWIYAGWIALEIFLGMIGFRKWSFPLRLGKDTRFLRHA